MVMHVCGAVVIGALFVLAVLLVCVHQRRMVVLVLMVVGSMFELAQRAAGVEVRHVVVVEDVIIAREITGRHRRADLFH